MKKSICRIFLLAALALVMGLSPDAGFIALLQSKLKMFYEKKGGVKIHLSFNQPEYVGEDTVYFSAHVMNEQNLKPTSGKQILNVKLTNNAENELLYVRTICNDGNCAGQMIVPRDLPGGNYLVTAYLDGIAAGFFQTELLISGEKEFVKKENELMFFPEGGNLVAGLVSRVIVTTPAKGRTFRIADDSGKEVTTFTTGSFGFGSFMLTPQPGVRYHIEGQKELLDAKSDGIVLHAVHNVAGRSLEVELQSPRNSALRQTEMYLVMTSQSTICFSREISWGEGPALKISIPYNCPAGVARVTVFTAKGDVLAERLVYLEPQQLEVNVSPDAERYPVRKPVKVEIALKEISGLPAPGSLSLSVYKEDLFSGTARMPDLQEYVFLRSDLSPAPTTFFHQGKIPPDELDDYLITQRWGRFRWADVFAETEAVQNKSTWNPYYFRGKISFSKNEKEVPDSTLIIFYLNYYDFVYGIYSKSKGDVEFPLFMDFRNDEIFYTIYYKKKELKGAVFTLEPDQHLPGYLSTITTGNGNNTYGDFSKLKRPIVRSFTYYSGKKGPESRDEQQSQVEFEEFDFEVSLDNYKNFNSMNEVLTEVVPFVRNRKSNGQDGVQVFLKESSMFATRDPLYFIDGVLIDSTAYFLALVPDEVSRIRVIRSEKLLSRFAEMGKNGIIVVDTKSPELANAIPRSKRMLRVTGTSQVHQFRSPDHSKSLSARVPDLRTTLFWEPLLKTDKDGKVSVHFYTGDATGVFRVRVEGITADGHPFSKDAHFTVSANAQ